jgi:hypothetical protein
MATPDSAQLAQSIRQYVEDFKNLCKGLDEYHTGFHINHMKELLQEIGGKITWERYRS